MTVIDMVPLVVLAALWSASFLFMRMAVRVLGPVALIEARLLIAGLASLAVGALVRKLPDPRQRFGEFLVLAGLPATVPFTVIPAAELRLTASLAAILQRQDPFVRATCLGATGPPTAIAQATVHSDRWWPGRFVDESTYNAWGPRRCARLATTRWRAQ